MATLDEKRDRLLALLRSFESCAVAFSGGVDSGVLAKAAQLALGDRAVAVTGVSPSLAAGELAEASRCAAQIGIRHCTIETGEFENPSYTRNESDRCFHCKDELYGQVERLRRELNVAVVANGANLDDQGDYRPGMRAARDHEVRSPLLECELDKEDVRRLAASWELAVWDKPASPCLSSRIAYGEEVTEERLRMVDAAEQYLKSLGLVELRVRYHRGDLARIEVSVDDLARLAEPECRRRLTDRLLKLGFRYVTLDLSGFQSGSLNSLIAAETIVAEHRR
ncbi:MAG: ATP-dependent sacrificial sulfur transferase LarE [Pirellulaceae bacterium]|jgi:uncharacterized protein|nr:ATP-dependent sacrificial sulfur transferase LarE [Pirellulaceae bacterium]MDP7014851.1 ATP-dependent sacrificial sulfur transferase LarE [Pirellulaceae bacterium]